ncbi:uncharacterized protein LOC123504131 isoform X2 [Portunus trituberculatus]|uniref:uncharacterized protein LOC123504131 isoform X2 n=1 Tax=Portunus trituberculatus TaxID=210409 RepID=UPI001E1CE080|nr:uncharacterized protein LOC123504131 isoform X2 [Portunus trituberculatus]
MKTQNQKSTGFTPNCLDDYEYNYDQLDDESFVREADVPADRGVAITLEGGENYTSAQEEVKSRARKLPTHLPPLSGEQDL